MEKRATGFVLRHHAFVFMLLVCFIAATDVRAQTLQFVYTSDAHYGITRAKFQGATTVDAHTVNAAMVAKINSLAALTLPSDGGVNAGNVVGGVDYLMMTGDISNREETPIQSASSSWAQFKADYIDGLTLKNSANQKTGICLLAGNHDVSNAIGYYKTMVPATDSTVMMNIYNMMMPAPRPAGNYSYASERIHYSKDIGGIHFMFVNMWPDSAERIWMASDLQNVNASTPVIIFSHDQPSVESKHFTNPNGTHNVNATDKFENLLLEMLKDGSKKITDPSTIEQRAFAAFVKTNPSIVAYFHGNDNENKYYVYTGPDSTISLNTFQVDSPMKGNISGAAETMLSFQLVSIDTKQLKMTVRECLWDSTSSMVFGATKTVSIASVIAGVVESGKGTVIEYQLAQNYPNPFNPGTQITYTLAAAGPVSLKVYDILGREVSSLVNGNQQAGVHSIQFDARHLSSGVYFYHLVAGNFSQMRKMTLVK